MSILRIVNRYKKETGYTIDDFGAGSEDTTDQEATDNLVASALQDYVFGAMLEAGVKKILQLQKEGVTNKELYDLGESGWENYMHGYNEFMDWFRNVVDNG